MEPCHPWWFPGSGFPACLPFLQQLLQRLTYLANRSTSDYDCNAIFDPDFSFIRRSTRRNTWLSGRYLVDVWHHADGIQCLWWHG